MRRLGLEPAGPDETAYLGCVRDRLELQGGQPAVVDGLLRDGRFVPDVRRSNTG